MNLTSKSRYAFKIMVDIARRPRDCRLDRSIISEQLKIPSHYLDQILLRLRKANIIQSYRGRLGGFVLTRPPEQLSVLDIVEAVEDETAPVVCLEHEGFCPLAADCNSKDAWHLVNNRLRETLGGINLSELASFEQPKQSLSRISHHSKSHLTKVSFTQVPQRNQRLQSQPSPQIHLENLT